MRRYRSETLIIGGGIAGIAAALELLDLGGEVLLLDRDVEAALGGLARESFGGIFVVDSVEQRRRGIKDSPALALADWHSFAEFERDDHWPRLWAETYVERCRADVYDWVKARGISFVPMPIWVERGEFRPGNSVPRFHIVWGTGETLACRLIAALLEHPRRARLQLQFEHRVDALTLAAGRVRGCSGVVEADGTPFAVEAEQVIVASGGINGSIERVRAHWHRDWGNPPATILNGSHRFADGRMHDAVTSLGGTVTHLDRMWNYASGVHHPRPRKPEHGLSLVPPKSALWLNWRGERIGPQPLVSGYDTRRLVTAICAEERQYSWQLLNRRIALKELAVSGAEFNPSIRRRSWPAFLRDLLLGNRWLLRELSETCVDIVTASSLPELVERMNALAGDEAVELAAVSDAVERYDGAIARGPALHNDEQLRRIAHLRQYRGDRMRVCRFQKILDPAAMPLIAIREFIISRKSLGGIVTDRASRVLDRDGAPISGLYAAGEAAGFGGGGSHGLRALEGTFLGSCILTGRLAARAIAGKGGGGA